MKKAKPTTALPQTRVAIYCRQSVATDLEFGSIDAQREAVEAYVASQRGAGWVALPDRYDDHGFSGGTTDRPAFQRLIADVEAGKVDILATYKTDRVSRSISDFTSFMTMLERRGVGFVSTTQAFDTRTSMGRLTLNLLASFSQFERETIAERTRDKIAATRKKGMWTGGRPVLGYDVKDKALVVNKAEAETVRTIFAAYLEHGGLVAAVSELERRGIRNKSWINKAGKHVRGAAFDKTSLRGLLINPLYVGKIRCGDEIVPGRHEAIVEQATFDAVVAALRDRRRPYRASVGKWNALLVGILRCARCGAAMTHSVNVRGERVHRYYTCTTVQKQGAAACPGSRAPAGELEDVVVARIKAIGSDPSVLTATFAAAHQARLARQPELIAESRRLTDERSVLADQRRNLLDALQHGGAASPKSMSRSARCRRVSTRSQPTSLRCGPPRSTRTRSTPRCGSSPACGTRSFRASAHACCGC
jgi:site-specific DNA recombinase